jgi:hypothetical protein
MKATVCISRVGVLAIGLGVGAAATALPGFAYADPFSPLGATDVANSVDGAASAAGVLPGAASAGLPSFDPNNFAISIDGVSLFHEGTATANSGLGDIAIADGANSIAGAEGGFGDFASADGAGSNAIAGDVLPGVTGNNFDSASAIGAGAAADAGFNGSFDSARAVGNDVVADAGVGNFGVPANFDSASVLGSLAASTANATFAQADGGSNDLAFVIDPVGTLGSTAEAGFGGNFDIAGALGDNLNAESVLADFIVHILPLF